MKRILDIYRRSGRYHRHRRAEDHPQDAERVDLVYKITEGPVANVEKITFIGNKTSTATHCAKPSAPRKALV